jgi:hypothetical protein
LTAILTAMGYGRIAPLLPPQKPRGRKRADDRQTLELRWERAFLDGTFVPAKRGERGWGSPRGGRGAR